MCLSIGARRAMCPAVTTRDLGPARPLLEAKGQNGVQSSPSSSPKSQGSLGQSFRVLQGTGHPTSPRDTPPSGNLYFWGLFQKIPPFCMCLPNRPPSCCRTGTAPQCCSALGLTRGSLLSHPMAEHCARTTVPVDPAHGQAYPGNAGLCSPQSRKRGKREVTGPRSPC